ncbi:MAG: hypothetical protein ACQKBW_08155, partial [Puniceicoccales bacterium]
SAGKVVYADATDNWIGITLGTAIVNDPIAIRLKNDVGSFQIEAAGAITAFADFYAADDGKIAATGSIRHGWVKESSSGDGDEIECVIDEGGTGADFTNDFSIAAVDNEDGTATITIEANLRSKIHLWTSSAEFGAVVAATTSIAATTGTVKTSHTTHGDLECITDANGDLVLTVTAADGTWYINADIGGVLKSTSVAITGN